MPNRSFHRPITINAEDVTLTPVTSDVPVQTAMTVNLKLDQRLQKKLFDLFLERALTDHPEKRKVLLDLLEEVYALDPLGSYPLPITITGSSR